MPKRSYGFGRIKVWNWTVDSATRLASNQPISAASWIKASMKVVRVEAKSKLLKAQRYHCHYCRCPIEDNIGYLELDHVIPQSLAPQFCYDPRNLVLSCKRCNNAKLSYNTTTLPEAKLAARSRLPFVENSYKWIHPQLHSYSNHIRIRGDAIYEGKDDIGTNVIEVCKLKKVKQVLVRRRLAAIRSSTTDLTAAFKLLGLGPHLASKELAIQLAGARKYPDSKLDKLERMFDGLRTEGRRLSAAASLSKL